MVGHSDTSRRIDREIPSVRVVRHSGVSGYFMSLRGLLRLCWLSRGNLAIVSPALVRDPDFSSKWFLRTAYLGNDPRNKTLSITYALTTSSPFVTCVILGD